jgi:hypothetical protein
VRAWGANLIKDSEKDIKLVRIVVEEVALMEAKEEKVSMVQQYSHYNTIKLVASIYLEE